MARRKCSTYLLYGSNKQEALGSTYSRRGVRESSSRGLDKDKEQGDMLTDSGHHPLLYGIQDTARLLGKIFVFRWFSIPYNIWTFSLCCHFLVRSLLYPIAKKECLSVLSEKELHSKTRILKELMQFTF